MNSSKIIHFETPQSLSDQTKILKSIKKGTPKHVHLVAIIASAKGVEQVINNITSDNVTLWIGAVDPDMTSMSYIVPGLGDAGDLAFGAKIDSH